MRKKVKFLRSGQNFPQFSERQLYSSRSSVNYNINMKIMTNNTIVNLMNQKVKEKS